MQPIVYFGGAIRGDRSQAYVMQELISFTKTLDVILLTEHIGAERPNEVLAEKIGKPYNEMTKEDIEKQDMEWVRQATHAVFEVSGASTGTGREIEFARLKGKIGEVPAQVLCLYAMELEEKNSAMIGGMTPDRYPNVRVSPYSTVEEAKTIIRTFLTVPSS